MTRRDVGIIIIIIIIMFITSLALLSLVPTTHSIIFAIPHKLGMYNKKKKF